MAFDGSRLFKRFYHLNKSQCGEFCVFYDKKKKKPHGFMEWIWIQGRVMKYLHENKKTYKTGSEIIYDVNNHGHQACQPERLSEKDYFEGSSLIPKK